MAAYKVVDSTDPDRPPRRVFDAEVVRGGPATYFRNCDSLAEAMRRQHAWHALRTRLRYLTQRRGHMVCTDDCTCGYRDEWLKVEHLIGGLESGYYFTQE